MAIGDLVLIMHEGRERFAVVVSDSKSVDCLIVGFCTQGYKCRNRFLTYKNGKTTYYCFDRITDDRIIRFAKGTSFPVIASVCHKDIRFLVNESARVKAVAKLPEESGVGPKSGGTALTSIYFTGQKIQGGYNTHKG